MTVGTVVAIERAEIHLPDRVQNGLNQMVLWNPLAERGRHQKCLIAVTADEVESHA